MNVFNWDFVSNFIPFNLDFVSKLRKQTFELKKKIYILGVKLEHDTKLHTDFKSYDIKYYRSFN